MSWLLSLVVGEEQSRCSEDAGGGNRDRAVADHSATMTRMQFDGDVAAAGDSEEAPLPRSLP